MPFIGLNYRTPVARLRQAILLSFIALLGAACSGDASTMQTAEAMNATLGTEVANRRTTATYDADRRVVTQSAMETSAALASRRQGQIVSTLEELGFARPDISLITPAALPTNVDSMFITPTFPPMDLAAGGITRAAPTLDPLFTPIPPTPTAGPPTETPDPSQPRFENVVTSASVGSDDCASGQTNLFTTGTAQIYVVANAYNIARGMTITSRWSRDGQEITQFSFTPDFDINGPCIWFFADQSDFTFTAGAYRIDLDISGNPAAVAGFTIQ